MQDFSKVSPSLLGSLIEKLENPSVSLQFKLEIERSLAFYFRPSERKTELFQAIDFFAVARNLSPFTLIILLKTSLGPQMSSLTLANISLDFLDEILDFCLGISHSHFPTEEDFEGTLLVCLKVLGKLLRESIGKNMRGFRENPKVPEFFKKALEFIAKNPGSMKTTYFLLKGFNIGLGEEQPEEGFGRVAGMFCRDLMDLMMGIVKTEGNDHWRDRALRELLGFFYLKFRRTENLDFFQENIENFYSMFSTIFHGVSKLEKARLLSEAPEEFLAYQLDYCLKQRGQNLKSAVVRLLESLSDHLDGFLTKFAWRLFSTLEDFLSRLMEETSSEYEEEIAVSFDFLSVLSCPISERPDLLAEIECIIVKNIEFLLSQVSSDYLKIKLFLFYGFYMDLLLSQSEKNELYLAILASLIHSEKSCNKVIQVQAWDSLNEIVCNEGFKARNLGHMERILGMLVEDLRDKDHSLYFQAVDRVFKLCFEVLSEDREEVLAFAAGTFLKKVKELKNPEICAQCLKIMRNIADSQKITSKFKECLMDLSVEILRSEKDQVYRFLDSEVLLLLSDLAFDMNPTVSLDCFAEIFGLSLGKYQTLSEEGFIFANNYFYSSSNTVLAFQAFQKIYGKILDFIESPKARNAESAKFALLLMSSIIEVLHRKTKTLTFFIGMKNTSKFTEFGDFYRNFFNYALVCIQENIDVLSASRVLFVGLIFSYQLCFEFLEFNGFSQRLIDFIWKADRNNRGLENLKIFSLVISQILNHEGHFTGLGVNDLFTANLLYLDSIRSSAFNKDREKKPGFKSKIEEFCPFEIFRNLINAHPQRFQKLIEDLPENERMVYKEVILLTMAKASNDKLDSRKIVHVKGRKKKMKNNPE